MEENKQSQDFEDLQDTDENLESADSQNQAQDTDGTEIQDEQNENWEGKYAELKDQYVRAFADFENTKKRLERDKNQSLEYANERVMSDLLPVLDTLEKALESARQNPQASAIAEGLELTLESFIKVLNKHGVEIGRASCRERV